MQTPDVSKFKLLQMAQEIVSNRQQIILTAQATANGTRTKISASDHCNVLKKSGVNVNIGHLKALLKEMGLHWYGVTCSILDLVKAAKEYSMSQSARGAGSETGGFGRTMLSSGAGARETFGQTRPINEVLLNVKDAIYSSGDSLDAAFGKCQPDNKGRIERDNFVVVMMQVYGVPVSEQELFRAFGYMAHGTNLIDYEAFKEVLSWEEEF